MNLLLPKWNTNSSKSLTKNVSMKKLILLLLPLSGFLFSEAGFTQEITFNLTGMNPHVGQKFEARLIDKATMKEEDRASVASISGPDFSLTLNGETGRSYFLDFYADLNQNGVYDAPPADHAWRLDADNLSAGMNMFSFSHGTNFTDIQWKHQLRFQLTGMNPHVGQGFGVRLVDQATGKEAGREDLDAIAMPDFEIDLPFLEPGHTYNLDFYADLSQNGLYDAPPTDHAWRMTVGPVDGDETASFPHGTNFTDIEWVYEFKLEFFGMNPHVGQKLELRVVNTGTGQEAGRATVQEILLPDFEVRVPGIEPGQNYDADFYADLNQNGSYDAPPADHAWRINFDDDEGDESREFTHNTNFTDIGFPTATKEIGSLESWGIAPNPVQNQLNISLSLRTPTFITASLYDNQGRRLRTLFREMIPAYQSSYEAPGLENLSSGTYYLVLQSGEGIAVKKFVKQ